MSKRVRAFEKAKVDGKIAITKPTATIFAELTRMSESMETIIGVMSEFWGFDKTCKRYVKVFDPFYNEVMKDTIAIIRENLGWTDFEGI